MSLWFYEPFHSQSEFDRLFEEAFTGRPFHGHRQQREITNGAERSMKPRMDLHENAEGNAVTATFELPGMKKDDVQIDVHNGLLTVSGETKTTTDKEENGYVVKERRFGKFSRTLQLPQGVKEDAIKAGMEHGVLTVTFPKSAPEAAPKKITIS